MSAKSTSVSTKQLRNRRYKPLKNLEIDVLDDIQNKEIPSKNPPTCITITPKTTGTSKSSKFEFSDSFPSKPPLGKYVFKPKNPLIRKHYIKPATPRARLSRFSIVPNNLDSLATPTQNFPSVHRDFLAQVDQALAYTAKLSTVSLTELNSKIVNLPKKPGYEHKKTLVLDLDETLVHCVKNKEEAQQTINVTFASGQEVQVGINIRPFAKELLRAANEEFEVIVFTASHKCYADRVLDLLDPLNRYVHHRLYRENCLKVDGLFIKDLRVLGNRRLEDTIIVDNSVLSFAYQLDNGIPVVSWYDDLQDFELQKLMNYLQTLLKAKDIRETNRETFHLHDFKKHYSQSPNGIKYKPNFTR